MTLAAAQAIDAVASLINGATGMSGRVHTSRVWPLALSELPAWRVIAADEEVDTLGVNFPAQQQHDLTIEAQAYTRATANLDDALHALAEVALGALFASVATARLSPLRCAMSLVGIRRDVIEEGEAALGRISLLLRVRFLTLSNAPANIV
jgi:hypothetical protein